MVIVLPLLAQLLNLAPHLGGDRVFGDREDLGGGAFDRGGATPRVSILMSIGLVLRERIRPRFQLRQKGLHFRFFARDDCPDDLPATPFAGVIDQTHASKPIDCAFDVLSHHFAF
jgi:hypothetical protein